MWNLCYDLMVHLGSDDLEQGRAPEDVSAWFDVLGLESGFRHFLQWTWPQVAGVLGLVHLYSSRQIRDDEDAELYARHQLLCVGHALNGDPFVLDYAQTPVVPCFVSHGEFWPDKTQDPRRWLAPLAPSLHAFWWRQCEGLYVPMDYNLALALDQLVRSEGYPMRGPSDLHS